MNRESKRKTTTATEFDVRVPREVRHVYCQNQAMAALLTHPSSPWKTFPLPKKFPKNKIYPGVVLGERPTVFSPELREAIEENVVRLIYVMRDRKTLPPQATDIPIFSSVFPPLKATVLRSLVNAAFENLILVHEQATLEQELQRARAEIDQLNQIGIALSTQRPENVTFYQRLGFEPVLERVIGSGSGAFRNTSVTLPWPSRARFAPGMRQLHSRNAALCMDEADDSL